MCKCKEQPKEQPQPLPASSSSEPLKKGQPLEKLEKGRGQGKKGKQDFSDVFLEKSKESAKTISAKSRTSGRAYNREALGKAISWVGSDARDHTAMRQMGSMLPQHRALLSYSTTRVKNGRVGRSSWERSTWQTASLMINLPFSERLWKEAWRFGRSSIPMRGMGRHAFGKRPHAQQAQCL